MKPYALIVGNPGRQSGWMSRYGEKLNLPIRIPEGEVQSTSCPHTGEIYELHGDSLHYLGKEPKVAQNSAAVSEPVAVS